VESHREAERNRCLEGIGLLVNPGLAGEGVVHNVLAKPEGNLLLGALDGVGAVADVATGEKEW
jgi:hypothetical protein